MLITQVQISQLPSVPKRDLAACVFWEMLEALGTLLKKLRFAGEIASAGGGVLSRLIINGLGDSQMPASGRWRPWTLPGEDQGWGRGASDHSVGFEQHSPSLPPSFSFQSASRSGGNAVTLGCTDHSEEDAMEAGRYCGDAAVEPSASAGTSAQRPAAAGRSSRAAPGLRPHPRPAKRIISAFYLWTEMGAIHAK